MLVTPKEHLPQGYPLPTDAEHKKFEPIFVRAFEIHAQAHDFSSNVDVKDKKGTWQEFAPRKDILSPVRGRTKLSKAHHCDCYERAYQELKAIAA
jgi:hypothetical protein